MENSKPTVTFSAPEIEPYCDHLTGKKQNIKSLHCELLKPFTIFYSEESETEYWALLPVKITIKRI